MKLVVLALCALGAVSGTDKTQSMTNNRHRRTSGTELFLSIVGERPSERNQIKSSILPVQLPIQLGGHGGVTLPILVLPVPIYTNNPGSCSANHGSSATQPAQTLPNIQIEQIRQQAQIQLQKVVLQSQEPTPNQQTVVPQSEEPITNQQTVVPQSQEPITNQQTVVPQSQEPITDPQTVVPQSQEPTPNPQTVVSQSQEPIPNPQTVVPQSPEPIPNQQYENTDTQHEVVQSNSEAPQSNQHQQHETIHRHQETITSNSVTPQSQHHETTNTHQEAIQINELLLDTQPQKTYQPVKSYASARVVIPTPADVPYKESLNFNLGTNNRVTFKVDESQVLEPVNYEQTTVEEDKIPFSDGSPIFETSEQMIQSFLRQTPVAPEEPAVIPDLDLPARLPTTSPSSSDGLPSITAAAPPRPDFNRSLHLRVDLTVPSSDYTEAYDIQWHSESNTAKTVVEDGSTVIYRAPLADGRIQFLEIQRDLADGQEVRRCTLSPLMQASPADTAFPGLPAFDQFEFVGLSQHPPINGAAGGMKHQLILCAAANWDVASSYKRRSSRLAPTKAVPLSDHSSDGVPLRAVNLRRLIIAETAGAWHKLCGMAIAYARQCAHRSYFVRHHHLGAAEARVERAHHNAGVARRHKQRRYTTAEGRSLVERWRRVVKGGPGEGGAAEGESLTVTHEMFIIRERGQAVPLRYSVVTDSSVLGPNSDSYTHRYNLLDGPTSAVLPDTARDCDVFEKYQEHSLQKRDIGLASRVLAKFDPIREFAGPTRDIRYDSILTDFKKQFKRKYLDPAEEAVRKNLLVQSSRFIEAGNRLCSGFKMAANFMSDRLDDEINQLFGVQEPPEGTSEPGLVPFPYSESEVKSIKLEDEFDWRPLGAVSPVRFQETTCSSCWAFAVAGSTEGALFKKTDKLVPLSPQCLVDCGKPFGTNGCNGTWPSFAYDYVKARGLPAWEEYTNYQAKVLQCKDQTVPPVTHISGHVNVTAFSENALKVAIKNHAPSVVIVDAKAQSFIYYKSGVLKDKRCGENKPRLNHAVLAVGWGTKDRPHFIIKNSWSDKWGEGGYIRIAPDSCAVLERPSYSLVEEPNIDRAELRAAAASLKA
ncbi:uncharacterized protein LOC134674192 [Cydia fagiglandana]|uniref:uncharacterized protein LOC134674192 n=1 Tax=Cydia fagiglandana TaxID=1458189 RepID=UPI002FEE1E74